MEESYSESDVSMSPTQILERLHALRQFQLLQRGKLQKQRLQYQETSEASSSITEIVSHYSNSISYNTFRSLLQASHDSSYDTSPRLNNSNASQKVKEQDLIEGVSMLNLSQESEFIENSPTSIKSKVSIPSTENSKSPLNQSSDRQTILMKQISLDDMPILSPKKDFETLILEKIQNEKSTQKLSPKNNISKLTKKKPFLKRGEGMARFGLNKKDLVIQNTKSLPWKKHNSNTSANNSQEVTTAIKQKKESNKKQVTVQILVNDQKQKPVNPPSNCTKGNMNMKDKQSHDQDSVVSKSPVESSKVSDHNQVLTNPTVSNKCDLQTKIPTKPIQFPKPKHPLIQNKGKTWAAVLTNEQNDFLRLLKQSDYYKNFTSPAKSTVSDVSCDDNLSQERELAEQNMFDLLENKVSHESFNLENSFFNRFLRKNKLELSGESTPLVMQKCLASNPNLLHIFPDLNHKRNNENMHSDVETCHSEYTECCNDACSSVSSCCSCKTVEPANNTTLLTEKNKCLSKGNRKKVENLNKEQHEVNSDTDNIKANMVEMNAKLIKTSELLKDRLRELEDEIDTFRKENSNLTKLREEIDLERQKFYEEKTTFEQKFNEEKILSEYYLAEEKEKLSKQKQIYDRYVKEMRGRLNKKDKDEVLNLRKEISDLKEEIRMKDAKSTSTIARLRNQLKIMEKEKKDLQSEVEKLKKENRRIQHSNEVTRRLTNIKYLEQINKKLSHITTKETQSDVNLDNNMKYKAFEIERQSRSRRAVQSTKPSMRPRAKSVPNLNVTSRYAKYFSQRDAVSHVEKNKTVNVGHLGTYMFPSDEEDSECEEEVINLNTSGSLPNKDMSDSENENNLEKLYMERFHSTSPKSNRSSLSNPRSDYNFSESHDHHMKKDPFFIHKSNASRDSKSPNSQSTSPYNIINLGRTHSNSSKSPVSILNHRSNGHRSPVNMNNGLYNSSEQLSSILSGSNNRSKSPLSSSIGNQSSTSQNPATVINKQYREKLLTVSPEPEPSTSKTSLTKTSLNPTEIQRPDGSRELRFPNGNIKHISADGQYSKFVYYNGDVKENFYKEGRIKYFYAETKTFHTTHADGLEVLEFPDGQVEKRYKDGSTEIRLPNGSVRYFDPKNEYVREEWRFPDGAALTVAASGEQRIVFPNGQVEVHAKDHKRREFPDGTVKLVYNDGTSETRYASGRVRIKDKHGNLIMDSAPG